MADKKNPGNPKQPLQEDGVVARLKNASGGELTGLTTYTGLLGRSSKDGYWLLYPTLDMSTCIEIEEADIVHSEPLPPEQSPFGGLGGTLVFVRKGAQVTTTRTLSRTSQAGTSDEFDLDLRVGHPAALEIPRWKITLLYSCDKTNCPTCRPTLNIDNLQVQAAVGTQNWTCRPTDCFDTCRCTRGCPPPTLRFTCRMTDECA